MKKSNININELEKEIIKKYHGRDKKKKSYMKISGLSIKKLQRIIKNK